MVEMIQFCPLLKRIIIIEAVLFILFGLVVTNMSPVWMLWVSYLVVFLFIVTILIRLIRCKFLPGWQSS